MAEEHVNDEAQDQEVALQENKVESEDSTTPTPTPEEFLASFDWNKYEEGIETVQDKKIS
jgi:small subunit ribosomal protein S1